MDTNPTCAETPPDMTVSAGPMPSCIDTLPGRVVTRLPDMGILVGPTGSCLLTGEAKLSYLYYRKRRPRTPWPHDVVVQWDAISDGRHNESWRLSVLRRDGRYAATILLWRLNTEEVYNYSDVLCL